MPPVRLGAGREFDLIRSFVEDGAPLPHGVVVGPGDDAAVLDGGWVVSTDLAVEDVHFRRGWLSDEEIGYRAGAAALSDLAAMGAAPVGVLVSAAAPRGSEVDLAAVQRGVRAAAAANGAAVIGGDVARSPGPLVLDLVVLGRADRPVLRSGARPGDDVWVTGALGSGEAVLFAWREGAEPPDRPRQRFARPRPRIDVGRALAERGLASAMLDVSDGVAGDAGHIAAASGVRLVLVPARLPLDPDAVVALGSERARAAALHGGEDFELLLTARAGVLGGGARAEFEGVPLTLVGRVEEGDGVWLLEPDGSVRPAERGGYDHWADASAPSSGPTRDHP